MIRKLAAGLGVTAMTLIVVVVFFASILIPFAIKVGILGAAVYAAWNFAAVGACPFLLQPIGFVAAMIFAALPIVVVDLLRDHR